jgi:hypothetical protein
VGSLWGLARHGRARRLRAPGAESGGSRPATQQPQPTNHESRLVKFSCRQLISFRLPLTRASVERPCCSLSADRRIRTAGYCAVRGRGTTQISRFWAAVRHRGQGVRLASAQCMALSTCGRGTRGDAFDGAERAYL